MPRSKRTKLALSTSAGPMRVGNPKQKNPRQLELSSTTSSDRVLNNSDDSEGLVTTNNIRADQRGGVSAQDSLMSGALAPGDLAPARARPLGKRKKPLRLKIGRDADHDKAIEALKARRDAALAAEREGHLPAGSTLTNRSPVRGRAIVRAEEVNPPAGVVTERIVQATPRMAPSVLEASNFKRRPRQPSLLRVIQAQANHQSEEEEDDLEDFQPDDESTPFLKSKSQSGLYISPSPPPVQSDQMSSSRKRKRTPPEVHVPMSQPVKVIIASSPSRSLTPEPEPAEEETEAVHAILPLNPNPNPEPSLPSLRDQPTESPSLILESDTLAPPLSSSPAPSPRPKVANSKPISGNPPSSASPPPSPRPAVSGALKPLSTASLQNLLPRRRLRYDLPRYGDAFDLPGSSDLEINMSDLGEDEDELTVHAKVRVKGRNRDRRPETGMRVAGTGKGKKKNPERQQQRKEKEKEIGTGRKTYARPKAAAASAVSDDNDENENHDEEEDNWDSRLPPAPTTLAKGGRGGAKTGTKTAMMSELNRLATKFRKVDEWKLDIEDVTGSGSSQVDAR
ncbi:hypothetical protein MMC29_006494 [Sticta canariensis]|nr:hypothetical protein [Sticta canariensis]